MRRNLKRIGLVLLVVLIAGGAFALRDLRSQANFGAGYVAHQICSCVFVAARAYSDCLPDLLPATDRIQSEVIEIEGRKGVRDFILILAERTAMHSPGRRCALD